MRHVLFSTHEATCLKPHIKFPTKADKHEFGEYHTAVDELAKEQNPSWHPVEDSQSFITQYDALTKMFDKCAGETFGYVKPYCGNAYQPVLSPINLFAIDHLFAILSGDLNFVLIPLLL